LDGEFDPPPSPQSRVRARQGVSPEAEDGGSESRSDHPGTCERTLGVGTHPDARISEGLEDRARFSSSSVLSSIAIASFHIEARTRQRIFHIADLKGPLAPGAQVSFHIGLDPEWSFGKCERPFGATAGSLDPAWDAARVEVGVGDERQAMASKRARLSLLPSGRRASATGRLAGLLRYVTVPAMKAGTISS